MKIETRLSFERGKDIGGTEGRNSEVFHARDLQLDANIVVKKIKKTDFKHQDEFYTEAKMLYATQHPNIAEIRYACEDDEHIYLSMPFYKNGSINTLLEQRFLCVRDVIKYSIELLSGVHYIHTKGLLHFDIKPTNILINNSDTAMLTDFGLAKYVDDYGFATPDKMYRSHTSPEMLIRRSLDTYADIYQCGLTLYRMCNGNDDFKEQLKTLSQHTLEKGLFPNRKKFLPHIPTSLRNVIKKALAVDIKDRYITILDMINDLSKIDKNLDWLYTVDVSTRTHVWTIEEEKTIKRISLYEKTGSWITEGQSTNKGNQKTTAFNLFNSSGNKNQEAGFKIVSKLIANYEKS